jgi:hypothetical protein
VCVCVCVCVRRTVDLHLCQRCRRTLDIGRSQLLRCSVQMIFIDNSKANDRSVGGQEEHGASGSGTPESEFSIGYACPLHIIFLSHSLSFYLFGVCVRVYLPN